MKIVKNPSLVLLAAIAALASSSVAHAQRSLTATPIVETFSTWAGTSGTLPANFTTEWAGAANPYETTSNGSGSTLDSGFYSFQNGSGKSFGILEGDQGAGDLADSRLFLNFTNNTGAAISKLRVKYKVQVWRDGARQNAIRLKYNTVNSGFSSLPDLANTPAKINAGGDVAYDGNSPTYYTQVDTEFSLPASLANGSSAFLRWQYSTAAGSGRRDGLGIADIEVSAVPAGIDKNWVGSDGVWDTSATDWSGAVWSNSGNYNAVFGGTAGTVTLVENITATDLKFTVGGYTIDRDGGEVLTLKGRVNVDDSTGSTVVATITAPIAGTGGLLKTGPDTLELGGANTFTGTLAVDDGKVVALASGAVPSGSTVQLADTGKFDLNGFDLTVNGLQGDALGEVIVPSGSDLTLNTTGNFSYKGNVSGAGNVIKTGTGRQRFRNQVKTYTGATDVDAGTLEITENGVPTGTSSLSLDGSATEVLLSSDTVNPTYRFGPASPASPVIITGGAQFATDTDVTATVTNAIQIGTGGGIITARGTGAGVKLTLNGALSGSGALTRKGQAEVVLNADSTSYGGNALLSNGLTTINSGKTFGNGSITVTVQGDNSSEKASLGGAGTIAGNVTYAAHSVVDLSKLSGATLVTGNLDLGTATILTSGVGSGTYDLFSVTGTKSYGSVTITGGGTLSTVGNIVRLTK